MVRVAVVQMEVTPGPVRRNIDRILATETRIPRGVDLVCFPELSLTGPCALEKHQLVDTLLSVGALSRNIGAYTLVAGYAQREGGKYNEAYLIDRQGALTHLTQKITIPEIERGDVVSGKYISPANTDFGKLGVIICADLFHIALQQRLVDDGAQMMVCTANWVYDREFPLWSQPEGKQGLDNYFFRPDEEVRTHHIPYVISDACGGEHRHRGKLLKPVGRSKVLDSEGRIVAAAGEGERILIADVPLAQAKGYVPAHRPIAS